MITKKADNMLGEDTAMEAAFKRLALEDQTRRVEEEGLDVLFYKEGWVIVMFTNFLIRTNKRMNRFS